MSFQPYGCGICGARFIQNTLLNQHRRAQGHFEAESLEPKLPANSVNNVHRYANKLKRQLDVEQLNESLHESGGDPSILHANVTNETIVHTHSNL